MIDDLIQKGQNVEIKPLRHLLLEEMAKSIHDFDSIKSISLDFLAIDGDFEVRFSLAFARRKSNPDDYFEMLAHTLRGGKRRR